MAGKYLAFNSRFTPLSYQEMLAPAAMATQEHQNLEEDYSKLNQAASV